MIRHTITFALGAMLTLGAQAQINHDALWCDVVQQALETQGVRAHVSCDLQGSNRVVHVTTGGRTHDIRVPSATSITDYSTPIGVVVDELEFRSSYRNEYRANFHGDRRSEYYGDERAWLGSRSASYKPEEVFTLPGDIDILENGIRSAVAGVPRLQLTDARYLNRQQTDAPLFVLKTTVLALQRGESFAKQAQGNTPPPQNPAQHQQGDRNHQNGGRPNGWTQDSRKVERRFALAKLHVELVDYHTGRVAWSADLQKEDYTASSYTNPMDDVMKNICRQVSDNLQRLYPSVAPRDAVFGHVVSIASEGKNKVESVYVDLGDNQRLRRGDVLTVYGIYDVGSGVKSRRQLGTVSVSEVQGREASLCKVKKGDKDIFQALHSGVSLEVEGRLD